MHMPRHYRLPAALALACALAGGATAAHATESVGPAAPPVVERYQFFIPDFPVDETPTASDPRIWIKPQTIAITGYGWCQVDDWDVSTPERQAARDVILADGQLTKGEDKAVKIVGAHSFVLCGEKPAEPTPPVPTPEPSPEPSPTPTPSPEPSTPATDVPLDDNPPLEVTLASAPESDPADTAEPELASTGPVTGGLAPIAALLVAAGIAVVTTVRRITRRRHA